ncbi:MAG: hypothetical protein AMK69_25920, partial [Nitrospira bacterium SG8_3]
MIILVCLISGLFWIGAMPSLAEQTSHQHYAMVKGQDKPGPEGSLAPRLLNLGKHTFPVTTKSGRAQEFINQGINLTYGFNHAEAKRAFREAARLDPHCAMAYWGQALVIGPNINAPMNPEDEVRAHQLVQKALALKALITPREQAYIQALAQRYSGKAGERAKRDQAYANAMRKLYQQFPDDLDAAVLFAEAMMDLRPWDYWTRDGRPNPGTEEVSNVLQSVVGRNPDHPGALHFWI